MQDNHDKEPRMDDVQAEYKRTQKQFRGGGGVDHTDPGAHPEVLGLFLGSKVAGAWR